MTKIINNGTFSIGGKLVENGTELVPKATPKQITPEQVEDILDDVTERPADEPYSVCCAQPNAEKLAARINAFFNGEK